MDLSVFVALLNPSIACVLALAFVLLWFHYQRRGHLLALAGGYAASGIGFFLQQVELPIGFYPTKFLSNVAMAASAFLIAGAIIARCGRPVPYARLGAILIVGLGALLWFMTVQPSLTWRIYAMNFSLGAVCLVVAAELLHVSRKTTFDRLILGASLLIAANFIVRTVLIVDFSDGYDSYEGLYTSSYWISTMLSHALFSVATALCLTMAAASDVFATLREEAHTDALSGLLNRRGFEEGARALIGRSHASGAPLSLVLADLDHFKTVNDRHGHAVGDSVIVAFSKLLRTAGPQAGIIGRTGGEEFAVLVPTCDLATARLLAEGLRTALSLGPLPGVPTEVGPVTASFGVASLAAGEDLGSFLRRADEALYDAKRAGRDCVKLAREIDVAAPAVETAHHERRTNRPFRQQA